MWLAMGIGLTVAPLTLDALLRLWLRRVQQRYKPQK